MKTILVATDFSRASDNAFVYGAELAKALNARLILFNAYQVPTPSAEGSVVISADDIRNQVKKQLEDKVRLLNAAFDANVESHCDEAPATLGILQAAKDKSADIIITGMKAAGKGFRKLFGSTVTCLARTTTIPLIVAPEGIVNKKPQRIALAYDADLDPEVDTHIFDTLKNMADRFHSVLYLVKVTDDNLQEAFQVQSQPVRLNKVLRTLDITNEKLYGKEIVQVFHDFISQHNIDMIVLLPHRHSILERLFHKSTTRSMIFDTLIPLLIIPEVKKKKEEFKAVNEEELYWIF